MGRRKHDEASLMQYVMRPGTTLLVVSDTVNTLIYREWTGELYRPFRSLNILPGTDI